MTQPYPPQQPQYLPPQTFAPMQAPQQPQYAPPPPPGYAPNGQFGAQAPQAPQFQGYAPPAAPPAQPLVQGDIGDFYGQPTGGGGAGWKFDVVGRSHAGVVARTITKADIVQITTPPQQGNIPQFFRDGRPKLQMAVPVIGMDGLPARFFVKGKDRDKLAAALEAAGEDPNQPPPKGTLIKVTFTHEEAVPGVASKAKAKRIDIRTPDGREGTCGTVPPGGAPAAPPVQQYAQAPAQQQQYAPPAHQAPAAPVQPEVTPEQLAAIQAHAAGVTPQATPQAPAAPAAAPGPVEAPGLSAEQQAQLAQFGA